MKNERSKRLSILFSCVALVGLCFIADALSMQAQTGTLEVTRTSDGGALGDELDFEVLDGRGKSIKGRVEGSLAATRLELPAGWVQVNCKSRHGSRTIGRSVEIRGGELKQVNCYFMTSSPQKHEIALAIEPEPEIAAEMPSFDSSPISYERSADLLMGSSGAVQSSPGRRAGRPVGTKGRAARKMKSVEAFMGAVPTAPVDHFNREGYQHSSENDFRDVSVSPTSTFSIDVDSASYANARRYIEQMNALPPQSAVRVEEFVNYFDYEYGQSGDSTPFAIHSEVSVAPWNRAHRLVHFGLKGVEVEVGEMPTQNLVFLIDVSGSMNQPNKLPLLKRAFGLLVEKLRPQDRVAIVVYASRVATILPSTSGAEKNQIMAALNGLTARGSTNGGAGIKLAYEQARRNFVEGGSNRVILATDGDFNVGVSSEGELVRLIEKERQSGVFLSVLGFGSGNYQDARMEMLSNHGNGVAAYIDTFKEARRVLVDQLAGTLVTIAKDVKVQIEFNPAKVKSYRLIGYANRMLNHEDFANDKKDAGDMGAGHTVTALYEIVPADNAPSSADFRYRKSTPPTNYSHELLTLKVRYKEPVQKKSKLVERILIDHQTALDSTSDSFRFAAAVAEFGMLLGKSQHLGDSSVESVISLASGAKGLDPKGERQGFVELVRKAGLIGLVSNLRHQE